MCDFKASRRYLQIIQTVKYLNQGGPITDDWRRIHTEHIREYREACDDFSTIQDDIEDVEFREAATKVETLINTLCTDLFYSKPFCVKQYYEMMIAMERMCRAFITEWECLKMMEYMEQLGV